jgi:hypothetical protein
MHLEVQDASSTPHGAGEARLGGGAALECDWCGRAVRRETAFERVQRGADGVETVLLCAECELGAD